MATRTHRTDAGTALDYCTVRDTSRRLAAPLSAEDQTVQSMPDVSPTKWHLAHTTWFFETFVLARYAPGYELFHPRYGFLFNSYYEQVGDRHPRAERGLISRPTCEEVAEYRVAVDRALDDLLANSQGSVRNAVLPLVSLAAVQFGLMLSGSIVIESVFAINGLGRLAWESLLRSDLPVVQAIILVLSLIYVTLTTVADLINAWLDPRLRSA